MKYQLLIFSWQSTRSTCRGTPALTWPSTVTQRHSEFTNISSAPSLQSSVPCWTPTWGRPGRERSTSTLWTPTSSALWSNTTGSWQMAGLTLISRMWPLLLICTTCQTGWNSFLTITLLQYRTWSLKYLLSSSKLNHITNNFNVCMSATWVGLLVGGGQGLLGPRLPARPSSLLAAPTITVSNRCEWLNIQAAGQP